MLFLGNLVARVMAGGGGGGGDEHPIVVLHQ